MKVSNKSGILNALIPDFQKCRKFETYSLFSFKCPKVKLEDFGPISTFPSPHFTTEDDIGMQELN